MDASHIEPHHHIGDTLLFENDRVRVWSMTLEPGEQSAVHEHPLDYVMVCIEGDRIAGHATPGQEQPYGGIEVDFFGEATTLPGGPATIALRTGAAIIPVGVYQEPGRHHAVCRPPIDTERHGRLRDDVGRVTQALADELEYLIRLAPEQWHLMGPNWPSDHEALAAFHAEQERG